MDVVYIVSMKLLAAVPLLGHKCKGEGHILLDVEVPVVKISLKSFFCVLDSILRSSSRGGF